MNEPIETAAIPEDRLSHSPGHRQAQSCSSRRPTSETRGLSKSDRIARFRTEMYNNVLPTLPDIPGFHVCWLSTTNSSDSVQRRESQGYERIRPDEMPGFEHITLNSGPSAGYIGLNEMVAAKLPLDMWEEYMHISHHERPLDQEEKLRDTVRFIQQAAQEGGAQVYLGDGTQELMGGGRAPQAMFIE